MDEYVVRLTKKAEKQLDKLPDDTADWLLSTMGDLSTDPRPKGSKKLKGRNGYRLRKGNYRIIYEILDKELVIDVVAIGHRKDVYK